MVIRRLLSLCLVAAFALASLLLAPSAAHAGTCVGSGCNGLDPAVTSCANDAITVASASVGSVGRVERRYSPSCQASWSRAYSSIGNTTMTVWMSSNYSATVYSAGSATNIYGDMWNSGTACATIAGVSNCA